MTFQDFINTAPDEDVQAVADKFFNGSKNYVRYHVAPGRKNVTLQTAKQMSEFLQVLGYSVPVSQIQP